MTTEQLARRLSVCEGTVQRWRKFGFIEPAAVERGPLWHLPTARKQVMAAMLDGRKQPRMKRPKAEGCN